jgi:hypothetical protein
VLRLKPLAFVRGCEERFHHADHADVATHAQTRPHAGRGGPTVKLCHLGSRRVREWRSYLSRLLLIVLIRRRR